MNDLANRDIPLELRREITRYGGMNPHCLPAWRVVWAQNVREQTFGGMRHMPRVSADADLTDIEPERYESGEIWVPRYAEKGAILERWFPGSTWGSQSDWEEAAGLDGVSRLKGDFPRQGDYYMIGDAFYPEMPPIGFWKEQIQKELRRQANAPVDPATYLSVCLYLERMGQQARREAFTEEVNHVHRGTVEPMLATVGTTAQKVREELLTEFGFQGHLAAG